ncbi:hypothetical protein ASAP_2858 [Asaia bogorensis]|uniref:Uncharacterized protein n=1 Tax=Asaia bogorensis TaxID=91915 RepID=A0A060QJM8_9PROT|nr:hypothetical protein ASAP_2858 [Asaia bogorensis]
MLFFHEIEGEGGALAQAHLSPLRESIIRYPSEEFVTLSSRCLI